MWVNAHELAIKVHRKCMENTLMGIQQQIEKAQAEIDTWDADKINNVRLEGKSDYDWEPVEPKETDKCLNQIEVDGEYRCKLGSMFCAYPDCEK